MKVMSIVFPKKFFWGANRSFFLGGEGERGWGIEHQNDTSKLGTSK